MGEGRQSRAVRWVLLFSLLFVLLISCSQSRTYQISVASGRVVPRFGGSLTVGIVGSPGVLNPLLAQTPNAEQIDELIYQGLTCIGSHGVPYPCLASSWQVQNGGKNYIFYLRKGVKFANGELFDAQDVIDTVSILTSSSDMNPIGPNNGDLNASKAYVCNFCTNGAKCINSFITTKVPNPLLFS